jgi:hypothetical protein
MQDEGTPTDTGAGKPGVSISDEEGLGKGPTDTGVGGPTETDLDRINRLAADAAIREDNLDDQLAGTPPKATIKHDGIEYADTPRIRDLVEKASSIQSNLPPVQEGMVRLYRGNREGEVGQNPSFTNSLVGIALPFQESYGGSLSYVDIPEADLSKYESTIGSAPGSEFTVPKKIAQKAKQIPGAEVIEEDKTKLTPSEQAEVNRREKYARETAEQLEKDATPRINAVDYVQKLNQTQLSSKVL